MLGQDEPDAGEEFNTKFNALVEEIKKLCEDNSITIIDNPVLYNDILPEEINISVWYSSRSTGDYSC